MTKEKSTAEFLEALAQGEQSAKENGWLSLEEVGVGY